MQWKNLRARIAAAKGHKTDGVDVEAARAMGGEVVEEKAEKEVGRSGVPGAEGKEGE